jgi:hypothetical protein
MGHPIGWHRAKFQLLFYVISFKGKCEPSTHGFFLSGGLDFTSRCMNISAQQLIDIILTIF